MYLRSETRTSLLETKPYLRPLSNEPANWRASIALDCRRSSGKELHAGNGRQAAYSNDRGRRLRFPCFSPSPDLGPRPHLPASGDQDLPKRQLQTEGPIRCACRMSTTAFPVQGTPGSCNPHARRGYGSHPPKHFHSDASVFSAGARPLRATAYQLLQCNT